MGNQANQGLHITPLTMAVVGALWLVLFALISWTLAEVVYIGKAMNSVPSQIADHEERIRKLEAER